MPSKFIATPGTSGDDVTGMPPNYSLVIDTGGGLKPVADSIRSVITKLEFETVDGIADMIRINISDPMDDNGKLPIRESKLFQPGNTIGLYTGYGSQLRWIGGALIRKVRLTYPENDTPSMEVIGYTYDAVMADNKPEPMKVKKKGKRQGYKNTKAGMAFTASTFAEVIREKAADYGMEADVDDTPDLPSDFIQKAGMSDYDFVKGLSNLTGFYFWVDMSPEGDWTLHFKDPSKLQQSDIQEKQYTFHWATGEMSSLLSFEPELAIQETIVKLKAVTKEPRSGRTLEITIEETMDDSPEVKVTVGSEVDGAPGAVFGISTENQDLDKDFTSASDIKLYLEDFSFDVRTVHAFRDEKELAMWALSWFRRQRENFVLARATVIGVEDLAARQIHSLGGLGVGLTGEYFFTRVMHTFDAQSNYKCDCSVRKIIRQDPIDEQLSDELKLENVEQ